jgi:hypothetical protein
LTEATGRRAPPRDRTAVLAVARGLVLDVTVGRSPGGVSVITEGAPGIGQAYLVAEILAAVPAAS